MSPPPVDELTAEERYRQAFERLKNGQPELLAHGTTVSQNNVALEAGRDTSALKKSRFPVLVKEIQDYLKLHGLDEPQGASKTSRKRDSARSAKDRLADTRLQRDMAQSLLASANYRVVELATEVQTLRQRLEAYEPKPLKLGRR
jgi:hypothetical protein